MNKLALGIARFGLDYGLTNNQGQVKIEVVKINLEYAQNSDIKTSDTAEGYQA